MRDRHAHLDQVRHERVTETGRFLVAGFAAQPMALSRVLGMVGMVLGSLVMLLAGLIGAVSWGQGDSRVTWSILGFGALMLVAGIWIRARTARTPSQGGMPEN